MRNSRKTGFASKTRLSFRSPRKKSSTKEMEHLFVLEDPEEVGKCIPEEEEKTPVRDRQLGLLTLTRTSSEEEKKHTRPIQDNIESPTRT